MQKPDSHSVKKIKPGRQMLRRGAVLAALFGVFSFALLLARLYKLQITDHEFYEQLAIEQQLRSTPASLNRGTIYDCNMNVLAVSATVDNVYLSPAEIEKYGEDRELIARGLSQILGLEYNEVYEKSGRQGSWYVTLARKIERELADEVRAFKAQHGLRGVRLETDTKRYYPNSSLACHLIGFVGTDNYGLEGIEASFDELLSGTSGTTLRATDAYGTELLFSQYEEYVPGADGCDIITSIDAAIQYYVEKHLKRAVEDYSIKNGAGAIAMDVNTGRILAMASLDGYDLNDFLSVSDEVQALIDAAPTKEEAADLLTQAQTKQWRNKALSDTYEPGSTFKIITLAMALEEGAVGLDDSFYCSGNINVLGRTSPIRCWKYGGHGSQSLTQAVQHSCNTAFVNIGQRIGAERFYDYCDAFGLLELSDDPDVNLSAMTGIDLAGESGSIWWSRNTFCSERNLSQLAAASFGQTFTITPLQLITAVSACVNGGRLMKPYVVQRAVNAQGETVYEKDPETVRQVISEETSRTLRQILEQVVGDSKEGTGRNAYVAGYRIGGKTGTSEKVSLEAATGQKEYIVSFIGFAPADEPRIALLVFLDTPGTESGIYISGGQMAAPVVGDMLSDILPYMGVAQEASEESYRTLMPMCIGKSPYEASKLIEQAGLRCRYIGSGDTVTQQLPVSGAAIASDSEVILYRDAEISPEKELLPELVGMSYEKARDTLSYYGIYICTQSYVTDPAAQTVTAQSLPAGTLLEHGSIVDVTLIDRDEALLGRY